MKFAPTMSRYLARLYCMNFLMILGIMLGIVYLFDTVELLRRAGGRDGVGLSTVLTMGLYKLPEVGQVVLPFTILFSAMFSFWVLSRRHELVVVRASGFSVWQFLAPVMAVAAMLGVLQCTVINPVGAAMLARYETLESSLLTGGKGLVTLFDQGLWLRQLEDDKNGYVILHAEQIRLPDWHMTEVMGLFYDGQDRFIKRIDASSAHLKQGEWEFTGALVHPQEGPQESWPTLVLPTRLTPMDIENSFSSPSTQSFWRLPRYIGTLSATGFDATRLRIHFHSLLAQPILFMAMVLLAATVSLRPPRFQKTFELIAIGVLIGFLVFFLSSFLQALGAGQQIPVVLAAWSPAVVTLLLGLAMMLSLEDG